MDLWFFFVFFQWKIIIDKDLRYQNKGLTYSNLVKVFLSSSVTGICCVHGERQKMTLSRRWTLLFRVLFGANTIRAKAMGKHLIYWFVWWMDKPAIHDLSEFCVRNKSWDCVGSLIKSFSKHCCIYKKNFIAYPVVYTICNIFKDKTELSSTFLQHNSYCRFYSMVQKKKEWQKFHQL